MVPNTLLTTKRKTTHQKNIRQWLHTITDNSIVLENGYLISSILRDGFILIDFRKTGYLYYNNQTFTVKSSNLMIIPQYEWDEDLKLYLDREKKNF